MLSQSVCSYILPRILNLVGLTIYFLCHAIHRVQLYSISLSQRCYLVSNKHAILERYNKSQ